MSPGGFTFVEIVIVGTVVALVLGGMTWAMASSGQMVWGRTDAEITALDSAQRAIDRISEDLRRATRGEADPGRQVICRPGEITIYPMTGGSAAVYSLNGGNLIRAQDGASLVMAAHISDFTPTCEARGLVRLRLTAQVGLGQSNFEQSLDSHVWIRNP
jgi:hypothetical protein